MNAYKRLKESITHVAASDLPEFPARLIGGRTNPMLFISSPLRRQKEFKKLKELSPDALWGDGVHLFVVPKNWPDETIHSAGKGVVLPIGIILSPRSGAERIKDTFTFSRLRVDSELLGHPGLQLSGMDAINKAVARDVRLTLPETTKHEGFTHDLNIMRDKDFIHTGMSVSFPVCGTPERALALNLRLFMIAYTTLLSLIKGQQLKMNKLDVTLIGDDGCIKAIVPVRKAYPLRVPICQDFFNSDHAALRVHRWITRLLSFGPQGDQGRMLDLASRWTAMKVDETAFHLVEGLGRCLLLDGYRPSRRDPDFDQCLKKVRVAGNVERFTKPVNDKLRKMRNEATHLGKFGTWAGRNRGEPHSYLCELLFLNGLLHSVLGDAMPENWSREWRDKIKDTAALVAKA